MAKSKTATEAAVVLFPKVLEVLQAVLPPLIGPAASASFRLVMCKLYCQ